MTNENTCGNQQKMNNHMWLYEWPDGDLSKEPTKVIVHKSIGSWELGQNYLRYGENDNTYGIALKATVGGTGDCHEADSFMMLDRSDYSLVKGRGWDWACASGHTLHNRPAYNPETNKYAMLCSTDWSKDAVPDASAVSFRMEDGGTNEFHFSGRYDSLWHKGGAGPLIPRPDGGFMGIVVGEPDPFAVPGYDDRTPTQLGLASFSATGEQEGGIKWVAKDPNNDAYYSWPQIAPLGDDRYLLAWGSGLEVSDGTVDDCCRDRNKSMRIPWTYWAKEINSNGDELTGPIEITNAGWGEVNEMVSLGPGRVGWSYAPNDKLTGDPIGATVPDCAQDSLVHYVYSSDGQTDPVITATVQSDLPEGELACEWNWTIRLLTPFPNYQEGRPPARMYFASCDTDTETPTMFSSFTVGNDGE
jgi:hypothetical protein